MTIQSVAQIPAAVTVVTTAETVAAVLPALGEATTANPDLIIGSLNLTMGTAGTAVTVRVRTGATTAGTLVGVANVHTLAAAAIAQIAFTAVNSAITPVTGNQYCVTVQATAATGNSTVNDAVIMFDDTTPSI
jgi:hypothetical protein